MLLAAPVDPPPVAAHQCGEVAPGAKHGEREAVLPCCHFSSSFSVFLLSFFFEGRFRSILSLCLSLSLSHLRPPRRRRRACTRATRTRRTPLLGPAPFGTERTPTTRLGVQGRRRRRRGGRSAPLRRVRLSSFRPSFRPWSPGACFSSPPRSLLLLLLRRRFLLLLPRQGPSRTRLSIATPRANRWAGRARARRS